MNDKEALDMITAPLTEAPMPLVTTPTEDHRARSKAPPVDWDALRGDAKESR